MAAHRVLAAGGKARGGGDGKPSATTSNAASGRYDPVPSGFGRRGAVSIVATPRRCPASPRRDASHPAPRRPERGRRYFPDRLLGRGATMSEQGDTDVLVVGGGPVGLAAALFLGRLGVRTTVVDQVHRTHQHTYALALHPQTLDLLDEAGLGAALPT